MQALRRQIVDSLDAFASLYRNPSLRRLQLAWIGSSIGTWGYVVALMVYAYDQGGPGAVGLVGLIRWVPAAIAAPFGGVLGDRFPRLRVMVVFDLVRAAALATGAGALAGFRTIGRDSRLRLIVALFAAQTLVYGGLVVLIAVAAIRLLDLGPPGIGYLNAALGVGGLFGGIVAVALVGARRLALIFGVALILWGAPILVIGLWAKAAPAFVLLGLAGLGLTLVDVAGFTLLQRAVPEHVLARVFGVLHSAFYATAGIGAIVAPVLVSWLGIRSALIVVGAVTPVVTIPSFGMLAQIDRTLTVPTAQLEALRAIEMFAPLPAPTLEALAASLTRLEVPAGETIFRQGDDGDRFYIVNSGEIEIEIDGRGANVLGPGDHFGEIALLRDIPRTATARARKETQLFALDRDAFLGAVTGHTGSSEAAETVVAARLGLVG